MWISPELDTQHFTARESTCVYSCQWLSVICLHGGELNPQALELLLGDPLW